MDAVLEGGIVAGLLRTRWQAARCRCWWREGIWCSPLLSRGRLWWPSRARCRGWRCCCSDLNPGVWIELLQRERRLLPAPLSLLTHSPWREAGFAALPPADPLWEVLWLLVAQERQGADWVAALVAGVWERGESRPLGVAAGFPPTECLLPY